jgi:hypothetical protein
MIMQKICLVHLIFILMFNIIINKFHNFFFISYKIVLKNKLQIFQNKKKLVKQSLKKDIFLMLKNRK